MGKTMEPTKKKKNREAVWTIIGLIALSVISASYVLNFRLKMKKYQVSPKEAADILQEEKEFEKSRVTTGKQR